AIPGYKFYVIGIGLLDMALSLMMVVSGFGLLNMKPWGRLLALAYVGFSLIHKVIYVAYMYGVFIPAQVGFYDTQLGALPAQVVSIQKAALYFAPMFGLLFALYPILVLIFLTRPKVAAAFRPAAEEKPDFV